MDEKVLKINEGAGLMTPQMAADYLQVRLSTIYQWSMRRVLPVCKLGKLNRYRKSDLDAYINSSVIEKA